MFTGKEVEKLGSKEKGITPMAIEEVLKSLLDDNEVMTDKIGTSNYYWAFASYERVQKQNKVDTLTRTLATQQARLADATAENERLLASRPNTVCHPFQCVCLLRFSHCVLSVGVSNSPRERSFCGSWKSCSASVRPLQMSSPNMPRTTRSCSLPLVCIKTLSRERQHNARCSLLLHPVCT